MSSAQRRRDVEAEIRKILEVEGGKLLYLTKTGGSHCGAEFLGPDGRRHRLIYAFSPKGTRGPLHVRRQIRQMIRQGRAK